jgi:hypothetical protein
VQKFQDIIKARDESYSPLRVQTEMLTPDHDVLKDRARSSVMYKKRSEMPLFNKGNSLDKLTLHTFYRP